MSTNESASQDVIVRCANAIASVGIQAEHLHQLRVQVESGDIEAAGFHGRAALHYAEQAQEHLTAAQAMLSEFVALAAIPEDKPLIQRP